MNSEVAVPSATSTWHRRGTESLGNLAKRHDLSRRSGGAHCADRAFELNEYDAESELRRALCLSRYCAEVRSLSGAAEFPVVESKLDAGTRQNSLHRPIPELYLSCWAKVFSLLNALRRARR